MIISDWYRFVFLSVSIYIFDIFFFQTNIDLDAENYKLGKQVEKLKKELEEYKKPKKIKSYNEDKENLASPGRLCVGSPGPLREKN